MFVEKKLVFLPVNKPVPVKYNSLNRY